MREQSGVIVTKQQVRVARRSTLTQETAVFFLPQSYHNPNLTHGYYSDHGKEDPLTLAK